MSRKNGSSMAKSIVAAIVMLAVAVGGVFASPLNLAGSIGNTRIYNESYKSVRDPSSVDEGWIVRTFDDELHLESDAVKMNIGSGSLVKVIDLADAPAVYLLDGWLEVMVREGEVEIKTPTAMYKAAEGSTIVVTSTDEEESIYVHDGEASVEDRISAYEATIVAGSYAKASSEGFIENEPNEDIVSKAGVFEEPAVEAPVAEEPVVEEPVAEPAAEVVVAEEEAVAAEPTIVLKPLERTLSYAGYEAKVTAYVGKAYVEYPAFVTAQEIYDAAAAALAAYPAQLEGVTIRVVEDGLAEIGYPESYGEAEFDYAMSLLEKELPYYIASLFAPKAPRVPKAPVAPTVTIEIHEIVDEPVVEAQPVEEPVAEPAAEEVVAAESTIVLKPLERTLSYAGYEAKVTAYVGKAYVEYPAFVTAQEIYDAAAAALAAYPAQLEGVTIRVVEDGLAEIGYPESYGEAEFDYAMSLLEKELPYYIASLFAPKAQETPVAEEPVVEVEAEPVEAPVAETAAEEVVAAEHTIVLKPLERTLSYAGYEAKVTAYVGKAYVEYPAFVTAQEIYDAAAAALAAYPAQLEGVTIRVVEDGLAEIGYPESYGEAEFDYAMSLLEKELPYYIASLFAPKAPRVPKAPVAPTVTIEIHEEVKIPNAPAEQSVEIELKDVVQAPEQPAEPNANIQIEGKPVAEAEKKGGVKLGATVSLGYGAPYNKAEYMPLVKGESFRLGFYKNASIAIDPYIATENFAFGLHLVVNTADPKASFAFDTTNGIAGYVSSVAKYIGRINYKNDDSSVRLDIDRTHEFGFASPIENGFDREFDETAKLAASFEAKIGILKLSAFMDDLEMNNKLQNKKQFAGMRLALDFGPVEFGVSAVADIRNVDILAKQFGAELYPAADLNIPFSIGATNVDIAIGGATKMTVGEAVDFNDIPYFAKLNVKVSNDLYYFGVGAAYNKGDHLTSVVSNSLTSITKMNAGKSIDALLSAGLTWGPISIDGSLNLPFTLDGTGLFVYNEVMTKSGRTPTITADTLKIKASIEFGGFALDCGVMFDGFCGKVADLTQALVKRQDTADAIRGIQDPDLGTYFVGLSYENGGFRQYIKGSYMSVDNAGVTTRTLVTTLGASFSF